MNLAATGTVALTGLDGYHSAKLFKRMAYAKPDLPPREIDETESEYTPLGSTRGLCSKPALGP